MGLRAASLPKRREPIRGEKGRFDYLYSDDELGEWVEELRGRLTRGGTGRVYFLFNNRHGGKAAANAHRLRALLGQNVPEARVVEPFSAPEPVQRTLFG